MQQVLKQLQEPIERGEWPVGSKLPPEADLLVRFGVSRVTLRQAVQSLVHVGMLETIQGSGTYVRATHELDAVLHRFLSDADLRYVLEARLAIESQAAEIAAVRASQDDIAMMESLLGDSRIAAERGDFDLLIQLSARFHLAVILAAHNPVIAHLYRGMEVGTQQSIREGSSHQPLVKFVDEHDELLRAIRLRDPAAALRHARGHLEAVLDVHSAGPSRTPNGRTRSS
ncbi:FadR/GntR family transcriptional regulator [Nocardioides sp. YIM 152315]|uniref:FadR/GntR family transcriptional regulator n=1 Tax=Nocardioides sp. YIM 152315 TaxID=3031760 RepID=UPI0023DB1A00|nr:FadR/GntR family transcriptional regulator [Nocardioides sp. YIM 152315]MDF1605843.1 FadR/GntR family transcriptional regulator [Nocardioides sp. YIM 152315]